MNHPILDQIRDLRAELAPGDAAPALVTALADGMAPRPALAELAAQQHRIIASDRRSLLLLATRSADLPVSAWFATLAEGESAALHTLPGLAAACGLGPDELAARPPLAGCQAYPAYLAWLALNGEPAAAAAPLVANFAAWSKYTDVDLTPGLRKHAQLTSYALVA
ncbi:transcriptional regulator [Kitasatospora sp. NPDC088779]|uniref:transcriptional regulator n=1 Tax=Kitasatospora sp. NPDC088779 TaxID=3154964 RepID=UPI00344357CE